MSKAAKKSSGAEAKLGKKDTLQAVVLADDFTTSLNPAQNVCPSILLPVANAPLLDYLVETLIQSQVQELYLYCSNHIESLKDYVATKDYKNITVSLIISDGCRSLGDALRDIDTKGWIRGDFILIRGDAFTNANLKVLMALHRSKCDKDKGAAVSLVFRNIGSTKDSLLQEQSCMFVANRSNRKVLFHTKLGKDDKRVKLELEWFLDHEQIEINSSFIDTHVYLCSPSVLPLFADNFDFQTMEDFVKGVLMNEDMLDARIYWQPLNCKEYALPITSWQAYHTLSRDILQRQGYPLTPEMLPPLRKMVYMPRSTYKHLSASLARGCTLQRDSIVGQSSILGKNTFVTRSVIGDSCTIGDNVNIKNSYIMSNVTIKAKSIIENSVVFTNCTLDQDTHIDACILSPGLSLSTKSHYTDSILVPDAEKIVATNMLTQELDGDEEFFYFKHADLGDEEDCTESEISSSVTNSCRLSPVLDDTNIFLSEVIESLLRGYQDKHNCDNLILEINSSRYAYNVNIREVTYNVVKAILMLPLHYLNDNKMTVDQANYQKTLKVMITYFMEIIENYVKTEDAQEDCLRAFENVAGTTVELMSFAKGALHMLYDRDILSEEKILEWYDNDDRNDDDDYQEDEEKQVDRSKIRKAVSPLIEWLREAEEDSSDDEND